jgi:dihydrofolate reductase
VAKLIYMMNMSLDGYIEDEHGGFGWSAPQDEEVPDGVRKLKAKVASDIAVAGPELAAQAIQAGLVDEFQMRVCPVVIGGGKRYFPNDMRLDLELVEERPFRNGEIFLRYAVRGQSK